MASANPVLPAIATLNNVIYSQTFKASARIVFTRTPRCAMQDSDACLQRLDTQFAGRTLTEQELEACRNCL